MHVCLCEEQDYVNISQYHLATQIEMHTIGTFYLQDTVKSLSGTNKTVTPYIS